MPRQASADGSFAFKKNLSDAKELKIKDGDLTLRRPAFAKKRGLASWEGFKRRYLGVRYSPLTFR